MDETKFSTRGTLYVIACASRPAQRIQELVTLAQEAGWEVSSS